MGDEFLDLEANRQQIGFHIGAFDEEDGLYSLDPRAGKIIIKSTDFDYDAKNVISKTEASIEMERCQNIFDTPQELTKLKS